MDPPPLFAEPEPIKNPRKANEVPEKSNDCSPNPKHSATKKVYEVHKTKDRIRQHGLFQTFAGLIRELLQ